MERTNVMSNTEELKRDLLTVIQFLNRIDVQLLIRDDEVPAGDVDDAFNRIAATAVQAVLERNNETSHA
jgi:hypothetical protein